jgi:hypothetical protein
VCLSRPCRSPRGARSGVSVPARRGGMVRRRNGPTILARYDKMVPFFGVSREKRLWQAHTEVVHAQENNPPRVVVST